MKSIFGISAAVVSGLLIGACTDAAPVTGKPEVEPNFDLSAAKADSISATYTRIVGELALGATLHDDVDYPDYYLGRTIALRADQKIHLKLVGNHRSEVRVYGPSKGMTADGVPTFGAHVFKGNTKKSGGQNAIELDITAKAAGTYLVVYTPVVEWDGSFDLTTECKAGCLRPGECLADEACGDDQFCGPNGVACIRAPCDVAYNICRPRGEEGAACATDRACQEGLACGDDNTCGLAATVPVGGACGDTALCMDGFCGCVDNSCKSRICKPFAAEGEVCGGFRMASMVSFCDAAKFDCVAPVFIADIPGRCGERTTVKDLLANPTAYSGHYVALVGTVDIRTPMCTKIACSTANPCCNACSATLRLWDNKGDVASSQGIQLNVDGVVQGCSGNSCNYQDSCSMDVGNYFVGGWFKWDGVSGTLTVTQKFSAPN